jgi:perosamine synthetase
MKYKYPVALPDHLGNERKYLVQAIESGWTSSQGPFVERFEQGLAKAFGVNEAVVCSSGTAALVLALRALGVHEGDEVIIPEFTMVATAWAVTYIGAIPVFVDCGDDLNLDVGRLERAITSKTKAIVPVHVYGRPAKMKEIKELADKHHLFIVEDAAEAHGATIDGKLVGTFGNIGAFSLFANKIITSGEGGFCLTDSYQDAREMRRLRGMYFNEEHTFLHAKLGYNFRMTNLQAAVGLAQLERMGEFLAKRQEIADWYQEELGEYIIERPKGSVLWMADMVVAEEKRDELRHELALEGIETRVFFKPMSQQPMYNQPYEHLSAHAYAKAGLYLPAYTQLTKKDIKSICRSTKKNLQ